MNDSPKPRHRWYQFSLKTLLIVVTVATVAFGGWVQYRRHRAQKNRARVEAETERVRRQIDESGIWRRSFMILSLQIRSQTWLETQFDDPGDVGDPVYYFPDYSAAAD